MVDQDDAATVGLRLRLKEPLRTALETVADKHGFSLNAEVIGRLERSLEGEISVIKQIPDVLDLMVGRQLTGLLLAMGRAMRTTAAYCASGNPSLDVLTAQETPLSDPWAFRQCELAVGALFDALRPAGEPMPPRDRWVNSGLPAELISLGQEVDRAPGKAHAARVLVDVGDRPAATADTDGVLKAIRERLAPVLQPGGHTHAR